ncbi:MAG: hypothetical protein A2293_09260 [Elusimicrobia bacterium RIFOXYB2_FULL_49_7]|nr:MAG: hypothetical protein A2293_09260 [Elusimicrobia bacterium RIFOXYB2_FULL_49_7]
MDDFFGLPDFKFLKESEEIRSEGITPIQPDGNAGGQEKHKPPHHERKEEARDNFEALAKAAEESNVILIRNHSPYRFCVYKKGEEVYIDIVRLNSAGQIENLVQKNITHDEFSKWIKDIEEREGLFFDQTG